MGAGVHSFHPSGFSGRHCPAVQLPKPTSCGSCGLGCGGSSSRRLSAYFGAKAAFHRRRSCDTRAGHGGNNTSASPQFFILALGYCRPMSRSAIYPSISCRGCPSRRSNAWLLGRCRPGNPHETLLGSAPTNIPYAAKPVSRRACRMRATWVLLKSIHRAEKLLMPWPFAWVSPRPLCFALLDPGQKGGGGFVGVGSCGTRSPAKGAFQK